MMQKATFADRGETVKKRECARERNQREGRRETTREEENQREKEVGT